ncbi:very short patch repair endonuclease [Halobacillus sp. SY10]|uniref:Very short patch repair endonuclease n=1 Tax=Halobacillus aidingensis TaxID=240303 RepID=A0A1H0M1Y3_HALAD|nr:very short patch repair endonuclease [Halobacillus aidingensis]SDO74405.1 DNA mismatch endonuclease, patch repair protein [Halobacillus aidingensis]
MADIMTSEQRKKTMSRIRARSKLEDKVSKALWNRGYRFRKNVRKLRGTPDIVIQKYKVVIFIDSCYWHACPVHGTTPKSNTKFWKDKFERNKQRDQRDNQYYEDKGWNILRVWEHDLKKDEFEDTVQRISEFIDKAKEKE